MTPRRPKIAHYQRSRYDGSVWVVFTDDRAPRFYGMAYPKRTKYPCR